MRALLAGSGQVKQRRAGMSMGGVGAVRPVWFLGQPPRHRHAKGTPSAWRALL